MATLPPGRLTAAELSLGRAILSGLPHFGSSPSPEAVVLLDGRILLLNDAFLGLSGHSRNELLGVPAWSLLPPDVAQGARAVSEVILAAEARGEGSPADTYHRTLILLTKGGGKVKVRASSILLRSRDGSPKAYFTTLVEVDREDRSPAPWLERLGMEDAQTLASALAELPSFDELSEPTSLTSGGGILLQVNRAFQVAFGWTNDEVVGLPGVDLIVAELRGWAEGRLQEIIGAPLLPRPSHPRLRHRDGRAIAVTASSVPVRAEDGSVRYILSTAIPM